MTLRPKTFKEFIGQHRLTKNLNVIISSANTRNTALPHILFDSGIGGLGKTTLANIMANTLGVDIQVANGGNLRSVKSILPYIFRTSFRSVLFIDEIHRIPRLVEEFLYPVMEDLRVDMLDQSGEEPVSIDLEPFTLIGATTLGGSLSQPFVDRFPIYEHLELYNTKELTELIIQKGLNLKSQIAISKSVAANIAKRSRGTPRVAINLLLWCRDVAVADKGASVNSLTNEIVNKSMEMREINKEGLTKQDKKYLKTLSEQYDGGPVGVNTLSSALQMSQDTITKVIEPFLIWKGLVKKTSRGREYNRNSKKEYSNDTLN